MANNNNNIDLEAQFNFYLEKMGLNKKTMIPVQITETRRDFFGGMGQLLVILDTVIELDDETGSNVMTKLENDLKTFWIIEQQTKKEAN